MPGTTALLVRYLRPQWRGVLVLGIVLFASIGLQLINPQILRRFIDTARSGAPLDTLTTIALVFIGVVVLGQALTVAVTYLGETVGWNATNRLREELALYCLRLPMSFHTAHTPGELIERVDGDVAALSNFFSRFVIQVLGNLVLLAGVVGLGFREDWRIGLLLGGFAGLSLLVLRRLRRIAVPAFKAHRQGFAELTSFWEERLTATEDLRGNGALPYTMERQYQVLGVHMRNARRGHVMTRVMQSVAELLLAAGTAAAFALGAYVLRGGAITLGTLYLVFAYTNLLAWNLLQLTVQLEDLQRAVAATERIRDLYGTRNPLVDGAGQLPAHRPAVVFEQVCFGYAENAPILQGIDFTLAPGNVLGLLGRSGSGKTTLTRLLVRFYDPDGGTIRWNGVDIRQVPTQDLRRRIGVVTQEVQLFGATVRDNLTLFDNSIPDERIYAVIDDLGLGPWLRALRDGLGTRLEAGGGLSAGEAQLLAFARVFLQDPDLVILDEASSRLDPMTEALVGRATERLLRGADPTKSSASVTRRTAIVIAHRLETVRQVDEIMILADGRIVEHGPRAQLEARPDSTFARLLRTGLHEVLE